MSQFVGLRFMASAEATKLLISAQLCVAVTFVLCEIPKKYSNASTHNCFTPMVPMLFLCSYFIFNVNKNKNMALLSLALTLTCHFIL